ncbi:MAG: hypothetical protein GY758_09415 [Fuerstiella sp.]|nr:hypothetical protein [Fuerstiella sp.]MCP4510749.1 hypothetical protein [Fuerstiella sp.]
MTKEQDSPNSGRTSAPQLSRTTVLHLQFAWWSLLVFLALGAVLEVMHGLKIGWYLDVSNETRRLMWTLAHAHGTLLALVHIAFATATWLVPSWESGRRRLASRALGAASLMIPLGFFLGGIQIHSGDPGIGILLLPAGAFFLFVSVLLTALGMNKARRG